jgi:hypothetical protein
MATLHRYTIPTSFTVRGHGIEDAGDRLQRAIARIQTRTILQGIVETADARCDTCAERGVVEGYCDLEGRAPRMKDEA